VLSADLDALGLQHLANVEEAGEVLRLGIILEQIVVNDRITFVVLLVREHDGRKDAGAVGGPGEGLDGFHLRKRLEAVLGDEARVMCFVG
jgi:hypothetical protein